MGAEHATNVARRPRVSRDRSVCYSWPRAHRRPAPEDLRPRSCILVHRPDRLDARDPRAHGEACPKSSRARVDRGKAGHRRARSHHGSRRRGCRGAARSQRRARRRDSIGDRRDRRYVVGSWRAAANPLSKVERERRTSPRSQARHAARALHACQAPCSICRSTVFSRGMRLYSFPPLTLSPLDIVFRWIL